MSSERAMIPPGGAIVRRVMETTPLDPVHLVDCDSISGYGPMASTNRHVRTRMRGGEGRDGERPSLTQLCAVFSLSGLLSILYKYFHKLRKSFTTAKGYISLNFDVVSSKSVIR